MYIEEGNDSLFTNQICKKRKIFLYLHENCAKGGEQSSFFL